MDKSPAPVVLMGSLAVAAVTAVALALFHPLDAMALMLCCGRLYGRRLSARGA